MEKGHIELFEHPDGRFQPDVRFANETVRLNQQQMAGVFIRVGYGLKSLFGKDVPTMVNALNFH